MRKLTIFAVFFALAVAFSVQDVSAGPPFVNLEGVGGVAFNPLAYVADSGEEGIHYKVGNVEVSAPRFGGWYVNLGDAKIDWTAFGVATTVAGRLEISYGYETVAWEGHPTFHKNNVGAKLLILPENSFDSKFVPAVSVGTIYKTTSDKSVHELGFPLRTSGQDWYLVATKTIAGVFPVPVILSGGLLSSQEFVTGVLGFHDDRKVTGFANIDLVLPHGFVLGYEFKQGEQFSSYKNANDWNVHVAWMPNKNLTLIAAYTDTASYDKSGNTRQGLGDGFVLSAQYAF